MELCTVGGGFTFQLGRILADMAAFVGAVVALMAFYGLVAFFINRRERRLNRAFPKDTRHD